MRLLLVVVLGLAVGCTAPGSIGKQGEPFPLQRVASVEELPGELQDLYELQSAEVDDPAPLNSRSSEPAFEVYRAQSGTVYVHRGERDMAYAIECEALNEFRRHNDWAGATTCVTGELDAP